MDLANYILQRKEFLHKLIQEKEISVKTAPTGLVRGISHGKGWQYYHRKNKQDKNGTYIRKNKLSFVIDIAQREYDEKVIIAAKQELEYLNSLEVFYQQNRSPEGVFRMIPESHQVIVNPVELTDEEYIERWQKQDYIGKDFSEHAPEYYSDKEERMRSKSEVLIANMLKKYKIPYKYEKPLFLRGYGNVFPDFTILDIKNRKEIYWEHFGMLDDREYRDHALAKIAEYERNGYFSGDRLVISFETMKQPLNMKLLEMKIQNLFT